MLTHKTKGIVLKTVRYGETSIIAGIYTELFGLQSYLVNGVRITSKKGSGKANLLQPGAILDMMVYHNELRNLQRLKEFKWAIVYDNIFFNVFRNAVALFMVELLQRTIKQPEPNPALFSFIEDAFIHLDKSNDSTAANFSLYFAINLSGFYGFRIADRYSADRDILDLTEGTFVNEKPKHVYFLENEYSHVISDLLKVMQPSELSHIKLNQEARRVLLHAFEMFYALHIQDFGKMKTLPVLEAVLS
ncbi:MAG TPA: DNA repair protein RecO [Flavitalea sp.]|nr:DNA repair protein RecO [Flavitalea sp.]